MIVRSAVPFLAAVTVYWISARALPPGRRALALVMVLPVLCAVTFEEYSEERWGVRSGADLTTLFNARIVESLPVSLFDLLVLVAVASALAVLRPVALAEVVTRTSTVLRWLIGAALLGLVLGVALGAARLSAGDGHELFHLLREARPLVLALVGLVLVAAVLPRDPIAARACGHAIVAGIVGRAVVGTARHIGGEGRWYHGDRMVYFDATDSLLFVVALAALAVVAARSRRLTTLLLCGLGAAPLAYAFVFSYRRSVWLGALAALLLVAVLERRALLARPRLLAGAAALALVAGGAVLAYNDPSFLMSRVQSIVAVDGEPSNEFRVHDLRNGLHDIAAHRGLGAGFGGQAEVVSTTPDQSEFIEHATRLNHNSAVYLVMKMGVAGGGAWLALLVTACVRAIAQTQDRAAIRRRLAQVIAPVLVAAGVTSMFLPLVYNVRPMLLWAVAAGIILAPDLALAAPSRPPPGHERQQTGA
jgi:O-antigen ligase